MRYDTKPIADYDLSSLRVLGSVGKLLPTNINSCHLLFLSNVLDELP